MVSFVDVRQRVAGVRPEVRVALGLTALLLTYSNGTSVFSGDTREQFLLWSNLALLAALLAWSLGAARCSLGELGLDPRNVPGSAAFGIVVSLLAALPPVLFILLAPAVSGDPVEADEITERSGAGMAYFLLFRQPVGTALFEEAAFRGVLYAAWQRVGGERAAFVATSVAFSLWHVVISSRTVVESDVVDSPPAVAAGIVVSLVGLFVGGLLFAYLRWHTRSIAAPVAAHWLVVAAMTAAVWAMA